MYEIMLKNMV